MSLVPSPPSIIEVAALTNACMNDRSGDPAALINFVAWYLVKIVFNALDYEVLEELNSWYFGTVNGQLKNLW